MRCASLRCIWGARGLSNGNADEGSGIGIWGGAPRVCSMRLVGWLVQKAPLFLSCFMLLYVAWWFSEAVRTFNKHIHVALCDTPKWLYILAFNYLQRLLKFNIHMFKNMQYFANFDIQFLYLWLMKMQKMTIEIAIRILKFKAVIHRKERLIGLRFMLSENSASELRAFDFLLSKGFCLVSPYNLK